MKTKQEIKEYQAKWYLNHKDEVKDKVKKYYLKHRKERLDYYRKKRKTRPYDKKYQAKWRAKHKKVKKYQKRRCGTCPDYNQEFGCRYEHCAKVKSNKYVIFVNPL